MLARMLQAEGRGLTIVFSRTKRTAAKVADELVERGFAAAAIHGDLGQGAREQALRAFRNGKVDVLVATDVAARGIDVENVTHVINYQCPEDEKTYLHRIGRTGRAGNTGIAVTFVDWDDLPRWGLINKALDLGIPEPEETYSSLRPPLRAARHPRDRQGPPARSRRSPRRPRRRGARGPRRDRQVQRSSPAAGRPRCAAVVTAATRDGGRRDGGRGGSRRRRSDSGRAGGAAPREGGDAAAAAPQPQPSPHPWRLGRRRPCRPGGLRPASPGPGRRRPLRNGHVRAIPGPWVRSSRRGGLQAPVRAADRGGARRGRGRRHRRRRGGPAAERAGAVPLVAAGPTRRRVGPGRGSRPRLGSRGRPGVRTRPEGRGRRAPLPSRSPTGWAGPSSRMPSGTRPWPVPPWSCAREETRCCCPPSRGTTRRRWRCSAPCATSRGSCRWPSPCRQDGARMGATFRAGTDLPARGDHPRSRDPGPVCAVGHRRRAGGRARRRRPRGPVGGGRGADAERRPRLRPRVRTDPDHAVTLVVRGSGRGTRAMIEPSGRHRSWPRPQPPCTARIRAASRHEVVSGPAGELPLDERAWARAASTAIAQTPGVESARIDVGSDPRSSDTGHGRPAGGPAGVLRRGPALPPRARGTRGGPHLGGGAGLRPRRRARTRP